MLHVMQAFFYTRLRITLNFTAVDVASASTILTDPAYLVGLKPDLQKLDCLPVGRASVRQKPLIIIIINNKKALMIERLFVIRHGRKGITLPLA